MYNEMDMVARNVKNLAFEVIDEILAVIDNFRNETKCVLRINRFSLVNER